MKTTNQDAQAYQRTPAKNLYSSLGRGLAAVGVTGAMLFSLQGQAAEDEWKFGIGTGLSSLALDGEVGFSTNTGGVLNDFDISNSDSADYLQSAFGFGGFANKGRWTIHFGYATLTMEDSDSGLDVKWDKSEGNLAAEYMFKKVGNHAFGVVGGIRYTDHEWDIKNKATGDKNKPEQDWTDAVIGLTHAVPINKEWSWSSRVDYGFGDSEGTFNAQTGINWRPWEHWVFRGSLRYEDVEYGDKSDINKSNFYYYDTNETTIGLSFLYTW